MADQDAARNRQSKDTAGLLRALFPCQPVLRDGSVVGAWHVAAAQRQALAPDDDPKGARFNVDVVGFVRTPDGKVAGMRASMPFGRSLAARVQDALELAAVAKEGSPERAASLDAFAHAMRASTILEGSHQATANDRDKGLHSDNMRAAMQQLLGSRAQGAEFEAALVEHGAAASASLRKAMASWDPDAIDILFENRRAGGDLAKSWDGLDRSFDPVAPLALAIDAMPSQVKVMAELWARDPEAMRAAAGEGDWKGYLSGVRNTEGKIPDHLAHLLPTATKAVSDSGPESEHELRATIMLRALEGVPPFLLPSGRRDWATLVKVMPKINKHLQRETLPGVSAREAKQSRRVRLELVINALVSKKTREHDYEWALNRFRRMARDFAHQIVIPALVIEGGEALDLDTKEIARCEKVAHSLLFSGRSFADMFDTADHWNFPSQRFNLKDVNLRWGGQAQWNRGVPEGMVLDRHVTVPTSLPVLMKALGDARNPISWNVLKHAAECEAGTHRILVIKQADSAGPTMSFAHVAIDSDQVSLVKHVTPQGGEPDQQCKRVVAAYVAAATHAAGPDLFLLRDVSHDMKAVAGYPICPGAWRAVADSWSEGAVFLRSSSLAQVAETSRKLLAEGAHEWLPEKPLKYVRPEAVVDGHSPDLEAAEPAHELAFG